MEKNGTRESEPQETITVKPKYFEGDDFTTTPDDLTEMIAGLYVDARKARSSGQAVAWMACFHEAGHLLTSHRDALGDERLTSLRKQLAAAGYYEEKEMKDPYDLGPLAPEA